MRPFGLCLLLCLLSCGRSHGSTDGGATDALTDAEVDADSTSPTVTVEAELGFGQGDRGFLFSPVPGSRFHFGVGEEARQAGGPDLELGDTRSIVGWESSSGTYRWLSFSDSAALQTYGGLDDAWIHFRSAEDLTLDGEALSGPAVVRWTGTETTVHPAVAGLELTVLGEASAEGSWWVHGRGPGETLVDGIRLGSAGEMVSFVAELGPAGLRSPVVYATGDILARWLMHSSGDLIVALQVNGDAATFFGSALERGSVALAHVGLEGPTLVREWSAGRRPNLRQLDGAIEISMPIHPTESSVPLGSHVYEPLPGLETDTIVRVLWDGSGDLPLGERWARWPSLVDRAGVALSGRRPGGFELFSRIGSDHRVALSVTTSEAPRDLRRCGEKVCAALVHREAGTVVRAETPDGSTETALAPVVPGHATLWFVRFSPATGVIEQQAAFDLGPAAGPGFIRGAARSLDEQHFLVGLARPDRPVDTLEVHRWSGGALASLDLDVPGGCSAFLVPEYEGGTRIPEADDPSRIRIQTDCDGPHHVRIDGEGFEYDAPRANTVFRVSVE